MNADIFAEWLRRQGHRVIKTKSSYWFNQGPLVYQAFPYHWVLTIPDSELYHFLRQTRSIGIRYSTPLEQKTGKISYHAVFEGRSYGLDSIGKWARKNVRRGLKNCSVMPISFERLAKDGWKMQMDTLDRQGRALEVSSKIWRQRCLAAINLKGFEAWGALVDGKLAASVITFQMYDCAYMLYQQCHRDYLGKHVNNALCFVVTQTMVKKPQIKSVLYGLHSLDAPASVDAFKFRMGYIAKPVRQRVVFHPLIEPLFRPGTHKLLKRAANRWPESPFLAKAEGMVRFYLQGRMPIEDQPLPKAIDSIDFS